ncbi:MAG TPA: hypothetical protein VEV85_17660 [Bryobacteraceae bacterium]|nr:hypothetical protein [Bryobacteraceae bacterium]
MRTTLDLDEDILRVARDLARESHQSIGRALSELARRGLRPETVSSPSERGLPVLPRKPGAKPVTSEIVKELLESEE